MADKTRIQVDPALITQDPTDKRVVITYSGGEGIDKVTAVKVVN